MYTVAVSESSVAAFELSGLSLLLGELGKRMNYTVRLRGMITRFVFFVTVLVEKSEKKYLLIARTGFELRSYMF